jgi:hypothetical protein
MLIAAYTVLGLSYAVLWSRNYLFRLRLSKSFNSSSDFSFVTTYLHSFYIKIWVFHLFLGKNIDLICLPDAIQYEL